MDVKRFKEQFSVDYLSKGVSPAVASPDYYQSALPPGLEEALIAYSGKVLSAMKSEGGNALRVFDIATLADVPLDVIVPLLDRLERNGMVQRVGEPDRLKNNSFLLTPSGLRIAA